MIDAATKKAILRAAVRVRLIGLPPPPPAEEAKLRGHRHSRSRDASAISHHYEVGNDFYRLVPSESMTYSCAYWARQPSAAFSLTDAQLAEGDLVARKLALAEGMRVLDVGCGWGTFALHAARVYGTRVVGVTLCGEQAAFARKGMSDEGVADQVEIRVQDYREVSDGPLRRDRQHRHGRARRCGDAARLCRRRVRAVASSGRLLSQAISRRPWHRPQLSPTSFIDRYVFPDGELVPLSMTVEALEGAGFEVRDVESLRERYALTLRARVANLERQWDEATRLTSPARARIWRLYMAGSALAFEANRIRVNQVLAVKSGPRGTGGMPRARRYT